MVGPVHMFPRTWQKTLNITHVQTARSVIQESTVESVIHHSATSQMATTTVVSSFYDDVELLR